VLRGTCRRLPASVPGFENPMIKELAFGDRLNEGGVPRETGKAKHDFDDCFSWNNFEAAIPN